MTKQEVIELIEAGQEVKTVTDALGFYTFYIESMGLGLCAYHHSNADMCNGTWFQVQENDEILNIILTPQ